MALESPGARVCGHRPGGVREDRGRPGLAQPGGGPTAWLSLEARHADPEHLLEALIDALDDLALG